MLIFSITFDNFFFARYISGDTYQQAIPVYNDDKNAFLYNTATTTTKKKTQY